MTEKTYDIALLRRLWTEGVHIDEIIKQVGCGRNHIYDLCRKHGIPKRQRVNKEKDDDGPTHLEIVARAFECRVLREAGTPIGGK